MKLCAPLACLLALLCPVLAFESYAGYQVIITTSLDESSLMKLAPLRASPELYFWTEPRVGRPAEIMAPPEHVAALKDTLADLGLNPTVLVPDVGVLIAKERDDIEAIKQMDKLNGRATNLSNYLTLDEIYAYLDEVVTAYPSIATTINIGLSYEGRPMRVLKLSNGPGKSAIFFDSAVHSREWAGPPTVLYTINQLTKNLVANKAILDKNDFYFLPVGNPDGYVYTWKYSRFWRKNLRPAANTCGGVDINRNFDQNWSGAGVVNNCEQTYPGKGPFSEPEAKNIALFVSARPSITFSVSVHSCGQYLLYPWGNTTVPPPNADVLDRVGRTALNALAAVRGTQYSLGSIAQMMYLAYGSSTDWNYANQRIPMTYAIELPCGGTGSFDPPVSALGPINTETWEAYKVFFANIPVSRMSP